MKRQDVEKERFYLSTDSLQSDASGLRKAGFLSLILHVALIAFLLFNLKAGNAKARHLVYRVTITPFSLQKKSSLCPAQKLPSLQPVATKHQIKEVLKKKEPVKEPLPLPVSEKASLIKIKDEEKTLLPLTAQTGKEYRSAGPELNPGKVSGGRTGSGGLTQEQEGNRWVQSGQGSGSGGDGGTGSGKGGAGAENGEHQVGSGNGSSGVSFPGYGVNPKPVYPKKAREKGYQGDVILKVEVLSNGRVGQIEVEKSSGYEALDQSALETVKRWKFIPAKKKNNAIPCWVNIPVKFQLQ